MAASSKRTAKSGPVYVGCSGWAYPSWKPKFYPATVPNKKLLAYYATLLNSVEVNYTFRETPSEEAVRNWLDHTGEAFRFTFKAPQRMTHILRLKNCGEALDKFLSAIAPVREAGRLGAILFQLPPNMKADLQLLRTFLDAGAGRGLGTDIRMAFEFRHTSWFDESVFDLLRHYSAALCVAEDDDLITPDIRTASFAFYRFRRSHYKRAELVAIGERLKMQSENGDVFAYFKHEESPTGALWARSVLRGLP